MGSCGVYLRVMPTVCGMDCLPNGLCVDTWPPVSGQHLSVYLFVAQRHFAESADKLPRTSESRPVINHHKSSQMSAIEELRN